ncbi:two-component system sensor histidine kinase CpxA [Vibrio sp. UCD-FRSSP16_10]|uniref:envelope stress sensor histidine kinase CpxA n=1 Tax=unclassified Vibrio TaxID=2614977 RepID=UPI0007FF6452|nr:MULTISPECIES: envelope stress sensor histidine kinase CpxA [unclassified Vibrio]OBT16430.1 two-component system sensor histidine kinase CpxA [Vibrio sp. UCD-FRSSP16_30]OBT21295.1 two-component system sensor histidine kinase CpxA [Vibrio sp. UCD-FRSSP16_10]
MNIFKFNSLYGRIFAIFWLTILIVLLTMIGFQKLDPREPHAINQDSLNKISHLVHRVENDLNADPDPINALKSLEKRRFSGKKFRLYLADSEGNLISKEHGMRRQALQSMAAQYNDALQPSQKLFDRYMVAGPFPILINEVNYRGYIGFIVKRPPPLLLSLLDAPFKLMLFIMLISTPLLLLSAWRLSLPARRLEHAAKRVTQGVFEVDPSLEQGTSEFKQTGASFNQMVLSVNQMVSGQQKLLSDISHELRSPLTRLRMANALATRKQGASKELERIETESERLEQMIKDLLNLSRMQIDSHHNRVQVNAPLLWNEILLDAKFEAEQNQISLNYQAIPNVSLFGSQKLLVSAFENIVRNAIRYGQSKIEVSFSVAEGQLTFVVEDDGQGVPEDELNNIFRPFYRVSTARDRESGGTGLGLAITENAVLQHNGTIKAASSPSLGGLQMTVQLPISE